MSSSHAAVPVMGRRDLVTWGPSVVLSVFYSCSSSLKFLFSLGTCLCRNMR